MNYSGSAGFVGAIFGFASLNSMWMVSSVVSTGLFKKCVVFPGKEACSDITIVDSFHLNLVQTLMTTMPIFATIANGTNLWSNSTQKKGYKKIASFLYSLAAFVGFCGILLYRRWFRLCSRSHYGMGHTFAWLATVLELIAGLFSIKQYFKMVEQRPSLSRVNSERTIQESNVFDYTKSSKHEFYSDR